MFSPVLQNKRLDEGVELTMDFGGIQVTRAQMVATKAKAIEELARERDPVKINETAMTLARVNTIIDAFDRIDQAKAEAEPLRRQLQEEEAAFANREAERFESYCKEIATPALDRLAGLKFSAGANMDERRTYIQTRISYVEQLKVQLSFDDAEKQACEVYAAAKERREWKDVVSLPKPAYLPLREDQGRIVSKPPQGTIFSNGHPRS